MLCYLSTNILMSNWKKGTKYKTNIRILESFVTQLPPHYMKTKQPKLLLDGGWKTR